MSPSSPVDLKARFEQFLRETCKIAAGRKVLLACSGGPDSVVLGELLCSIGQPFDIAHIQYHLRGQDSLDDEALVQACSLRWNAAFYRVEMELKNAPNPEGASLQMLARQMRYDWLEECRIQCGAHFIATAHHADDAAETLLMRLMDGAGFRGLRGIKATRDKLIRPLLFARKTELMDYAQAQGIAWRLDRSNTSADYRRNRVRNELIPAAEHIKEGAAQGIIRSAEQLRQAEAIYEQGLQRLRRQLFRTQDEQRFIPIRGLLNSGAAPLLLREWLLPLGFTAAQCDEIVQKINAQTGAHWQSPLGMLYRDRKRLIWAPKDDTAKDSKLDQLPVFIEKAPSVIKLEDLRLEFNIIDKIYIKNINLNKGVLLNAQSLEWPLLLRPWQAGDYFYPESSGKKRKLKRFLTDVKLAPHLRDRQLVLLSGQHIIWVLGLSADARFMRIKGCKSLLKISLT